jgi:EmrB/QacA subfamily drug resistance transporter
VNALETKLSARAWAALIVLCAALFLDALDVSMVGMALPRIGSDLDLSTSTLQWVVSGYVLGYGGLLLLGGRAADLLGRRRVFVIALAVFVVASLFGGLVSNGALLIVSRFVKGMSAAFTAPAGLSLITTSFAEGPARNRALGVYTATGASGFSLGLVLGGALTELGWRWCFLVPAPIALAVLLVARRVLPADAPFDGHRRYDLPGAATVTAAMLLLVYTVTQAPQVGWGAVRTLAGLVAVAGLLAAFALVELRSKAPLIRLGILRSRRIVGANLAAMTAFGSYVGFQFIGTLYLQDLLGWSSLHAALGFLPGGLLVALLGPRIGPLAFRLGTTRILTAGLAVLAAGYALSTQIGLHTSYGSVFLPTMILLGIGFGLAFPTLNIAATDGVANHEQGLASGLVNTSFQLGGAIVLAVVTAVVSSGGATSRGAASILDRYHTGLTVVVGVAVLGFAVVGASFFTRRPTPAEEAAGAEAAYEEAA